VPGILLIARGGTSYLIVGVDEKTCVDLRFDKRGPVLLKFLPNLIDLDEWELCLEP
jgi:hypothetical protein